MCERGRIGRRPRATIDDAITLAAGAAAFAMGARAARRPQVGRSERQWFAWVNTLPSRWYRPVWLVMQLGSLGGVAVVTAATAATGRRAAARRVGLAGTTAWIAAKAVKRFVGRGRPAAVLEPARVLGREQSGLGYPSGHAAVTAAMALAAAPDLTVAVAPLAWVLPALVASSRVYVGAHLPLDVVGGTALGVACGSLARLADGAVSRRS